MPFSARIRRVLIPAAKNRNRDIPEAAKASHMNQKIENFIIVGVTREGKKFRPSDW